MPTLALVLTLLTPVTVVAEFYPETGCCSDPEANREWKHIMLKNGSIPEYRHLYALWKDLCRQIKEGTVSLSEARELFENERWKAHDQLQERLEKRYGIMHQGAG